MFYITGDTHGMVDWDRFSLVFGRIVKIEVGDGQ